MNSPPFLWSIFLLLSGCGLYDRIFHGDETNPHFAKITGKVIWTDRVEINPDAELIVQLEDVTRPGVRPEPVAITRTTLGSPPVAFELQYDRRVVAEDRRYRLSATVKQDGETVLISQEPVPMLTRGGSDHVEFVLHRPRPE
ncbi:MAG TPA: YbaY family lipoprotein [Methylococcus sp.]|nr:YbaY family lipoprotein [Methylococcus sp.]